MGFNKGPFPSPSLDSLLLHYPDSLGSTEGTPPTGLGPVFSKCRPTWTAGSVGDALGLAAWQCRSDPAVEGARPCCPNPRHPRDPATGLRVSSPPSRVQSLFCSHHSRCPRLEWRRDSVCFKGRGQRSLARPLCREDGGNSPAFEGGQREAQRSGPSWAYLALEWQSSLCPLDLAGPGRLPRFWVSLTGG